MAVTIKSPVCRLSYPFLFKPRPAKRAGDKPKFGAMLIFDEDALPVLRKAVLEAAEEQFGEKAADMLRAKKLKNPIRPGDDQPDNPHVQGKWFVNVSSQNQPEVVDRHLNIVTDPARVYAGMFVRGLLAFKYYDVENKGIGVYLNGMQLVREGERIDGRTSAKAAFDDGADLGPEDEADAGSGGKADDPWS